MQAVLKQFKSAPIPSALAAIVTDFERGFNSRGVGTLGAAYNPP
jgi:hypothetical protein